MKAQAIGQVRIENQTFSIRASAHAMARMAERKVEVWAVVGTVIALGPERLTSIKAAQEEAIIINKDENIAVVIGTKKNTITVVTVIHSANVYVKTATRIETI